MKNNENADNKKTILQILLRKRTKNKNYCY